MVLTRQMPVITSDRSVQTDKHEDYRYLMDMVDREHSGRMLIMLEWRIAVLRHQVRDVVESIRRNYSDEVFVNPPPRKDAGQGSEAACPVGAAQTSVNKDQLKTQAKEEGSCPQAGQGKMISKTESLVGSKIKARTDTTSKSQTRVDPTKDTKMKSALELKSTSNLKVSSVTDYRGSYQKKSETLPHNIVKTNKAVTVKTQMLINTSELPKAKSKMETKSLAFKSKTPTGSTKSIREAKTKSHFKLDSIKEFKTKSTKEEVIKTHNYMESPKTRNTAGSPKTELSARSLRETRAMTTMKTHGLPTKKFDNQKKSKIETPRKIVSPVVSKLPLIMEASPKFEIEETAPKAMTYEIEEYDSTIDLEAEENQQNKKDEKKLEVVYKAFSGFGKDSSLKYAMIEELSSELNIPKNFPPSTADKNRKDFIAVMPEDSYCCKMLHPPGAKSEPVKKPVVDKEALSNLLVQNVLEELRVGTTGGSTWELN